MPLKLKDLLAEANAKVKRIDGKTAEELVASGALLLDVRDAPELERAGRAEPAHHIPRGMLEFRADPDSPYHDPVMDPDRPVVLYCASGGRAALAGKRLVEMGYKQVYNLGGLNDWTGEKREGVDRGM